MPEPPGTLMVWLVGALSAAVTAVAAVALHDWILVAVLVWGLLAMGGIVMLRTTSRVLTAAKLGIFIGLTAGIAFIVWGPIRFFAPPEA